MQTLMVGSGKTICRDQPQVFHYAQLHTFYTPLAGFHDFILEFIFHRIPCASPHLRINYPIIRESTCNHAKITLLGTQPANRLKRSLAKLQVGNRAKYLQHSKKWFIEMSDEQFKPLF